MSKSVELLAGSEDGEPNSTENSRTSERSKVNLNGGRQLSKSATELRENEIASNSPSRGREDPVASSSSSGVIHHHRHHRHVASVAQRTHTFFATLRSRWSRSRSKERKRSKDTGNALGQDVLGCKSGAGVESDYAADYSSEHSRSSSATQSPARHCLNHPESPLARAAREKVVTRQEDSPGKCSNGSSKGSLNYQATREAYNEEPCSSMGERGMFSQDEGSRRRELALRQHAFFQLRLHIRRGANLVAMDRCGASDPYVKIKSSGRLLHKSRTVHRDLNPVWDESVTLPIEDPFQPLTIKVFDYDWGLQDDFMGAAQLDLTQLDLGHPHDIVLELKDPARPKQHLGEIFLTATLWPRNQQEKEQEMGQDQEIREELREVERKQREMERELREMEQDLREMDEKNRENEGKPETDKKSERDSRSSDKFQENSKDQGISLGQEVLVNNDVSHDTGQSSSLDIKKDEERKEDECGSNVQEKRRASSTENINFDFRFIPASREDEEASIESKVDHFRSLRSGSPKFYEKSTFDLPASLISRIRKLDHFRARSADDIRFVETVEEEGILEMKDVKHHDLLDKLKDNVKEKMEDIHRYFQRTNRLADVNRKLKSQIWSSVVTIVLVEAKNLLPMDIDGLSDPYVKFRLGTEKYKSKVVNKTLNPVWLEQFDLHLYEDPYLGQELEVTVWDRDKSHQDDLMGKTVIDLATLERETTHRLWRELEDGSGSIFLLLTISGTTASETISDLAAHEETPVERVHLMQRYAILNSLQRLRDVGHLTVKVYRAQGLAAADLGGKSDPFCVLELVNARLQTQTEYKTLAPNWQKIFTFNVKDINSVLEVTVYDEDRDHKVEFLGKVAIPLLRIRNGEKRWYALKDKKLRGRAKGNSPQILLEMTVVWNVIRACVRTLNPKEKKYMEPEVKFKRQVFLRNVLRLKAIIVIFIDMGKYIQSCWEWESKPRSIVALVLFILGCYYFEPYMIPTIAMLILLKYYLVAVVTGVPLTHQTSHFHDEIGSDDCPPTPGDDDDDEDDKDKEEKKSLKERLQAIQEVTQTVQNSIGYIASLCERVKNLFNFTVPYLSYLAMILAILGACVLYFIPVRYLILAWGVNKFSRKIFRPHSVPNNEVLDLISRVPDDEELLNYRELKPLPTADSEKGSSTSGTGNTARREQRKRHKVA